MTTHAYDSRVVFSFIFLSSICANALYYDSSRVYVDKEGSLQNILVVLHHHVKEDPSLLDKIQNHMVEASQSLHTAVGLRFGNVTIVVPASWQSTTSQAYPSAFKESAELSDFLVSNDFSTMRTQHLLGCGKEALITYCSTDFFLKSPSETTGKLLMHEFLHKRYGVFDEHPIDGDGHVDSNEFYHSSRSSIEPVGCSSELTGNVLSNNANCKYQYDFDQTVSLWKKSCKFTPTNPTSVIASVMSNPELTNVKAVCNDSNHNAEASNRQNRLCQGRSVRSVLNTHKDFADTVPSAAVFSQPIFHRKRQTVKRNIALVVDYSNSMNGSRLYLAKQAISSLIQSVVEDYATLVIVAFDKTATELFPPQEMSTVTRQTAIQSLNSRSTGEFTCIGCGLTLAYKTMAEKMGGVSGSLFILMTDGIETENKQDIEKMFDKSISEQFIINTILLTEETGDYLVSFSRQTGSNTFSASEDPAALIDAFTDTLISRQNLTAKVIQVISESYTLQPMTTQPVMFYIDGTLRDTVVTLYWDQSALEHLNITLLDGKGNLLDFSVTDTKGTMGFSCFKLREGASKCQPCNLLVRNTNNKTETVTITVNAWANPLKPSPIEMRAFINGDKSFTVTGSEPPLVTIHSILMSGSWPVAADSVIADVKFESLPTTIGDASSPKITKLFNITLRDKGTGADVLEGDGVYSTYFTNYLNVNGSYFVRIRATGRVNGDTFMRYVSLGYFTVYVSPNVDIKTLIPPAPIVDLRVVEIRADSVTLNWTAVGDDYDVGTVKKYFVYVTNSAEELRMNRSTVLQIISNPSGSGATESARLSLDTSNQTAWLAITAEDSNELVNNLSNIVSAMYISKIHTEDLPIVLYIIPTYVWYALGAAAFLLIVIIIVAVVVSKRSSNRKEANPQGRPLTRAPSISWNDTENQLPEVDTVESPCDLYSSYPGKPLASAGLARFSAVLRNAIIKMTPHTEANLQSGADGSSTPAKTVGRRLPEQQLTDASKKSNSAETVDIQKEMRYAEEIATQALTRENTK